MKKFKYRAETYLNYVEHLRDQALQEMKEAEFKMKNIEKAIEKLGEKMKKAYQKSSLVGKGIDNIHVIKDNNQFIEGLKVKLKDLSNDLHQAEDIYRDKYQKLMDLQLKLKTIEKHKEKAKKDFDKELKKRQQKFTDEINSIRQGSKDAKSVSKV